MNTSQQIWTFLAANPGADSHAIAAAVGEATDKVQRTLNKAVARGHAVCEGAKGSRRYTLLNRPKPRAQTPEERAAKRKAWRKQWLASRPKPEPKRNPRAFSINRPITVLKKKQHGPVDVSGDVAAFLRAGGRIQKLPRHAVSQPLQRITG